MRIRGLADRWGDGVVAVALAIAAQSELWFNAPSGWTVTGGRGVLAVLFGLMTVPLAWRRRAPVEVLFVVTGALAVSTVLQRPEETPAGVFLALILAFYSVGANCEERRGLPPRRLARVRGGVACRSRAAPPSA